jgi:hypothetical protein
MIASICVCLPRRAVSGRIGIVQRSSRLATSAEPQDELLQARPSPTIGVEPHFSPTEHCDVVNPGIQAFKENAIFPKRH